MHSVYSRTDRISTWAHRSGRRIMGVLLLIALGVVSSAISGCALVTAPQASSAMNVSIEIQHFKVGKTHVSIGFSDAKLNPIEFVSGETVACDGQFLRYEAAHYIGDVPKQPDTG